MTVSILATTFTLNLMYPPLTITNDLLKTCIKLFAVESDPLTLEKQELQQPSSLALSYIHRFITDAARREQLENLKRKPSQRALSPVAAIRSITPTGITMHGEGCHLSVCSQTLKFP